MTTKTINGKEFLFVQVPEGSTIAYLYREDDLYVIMPHDKVYNITLIGRKENERYHIIGLASNLTEDEWKGIVEKDEIFTEGPYPNDTAQWWPIFRDYSASNTILATATQSGQSLLKSLNLNLETTLIILKK